MGARVYETHGDRQITFHVVKMPVFDVRGSVVSVAGIGFDVTEQRRKVSRRWSGVRNRWICFLQRSPEHVCVLDIDRSIEFANARMCEFLGAYPSELKGRDVADLVAPADRERIDRVHRTRRGRRKRGYEVVRAANATGAVRLLEVSGVLVLRADSPHSVVMLGRDVTEQESRNGYSPRRSLPVILTSHGARLSLDGCSSVLNRGLWSDVKLPAWNRDSLAGQVDGDRHVLRRGRADEAEAVSDGPSTIDMSPAFSAG